MKVLVSGTREMQLLSQESSDNRPKDSGQKARDQLERLLAAIREGKATGSSYLRIDSNQGGVTRVRFAVESE